MDTNTFDLDAYVDELLLNTSPDELFDFFEEQGIFDSLKAQAVWSIELDRKSVMNPCLPEWKTNFGFGKNETAGPGLSLFQQNESGQ